MESHCILLLGSEREGSFPYMMISQLICSRLVKEPSEQMAISGLIFQKKNSNLVDSADELILKVFHDAL